MSEQFASLQMLQGSAMVGRDVITEGNVLARDGNTASGVFELPASTTGTKVQVLTPGGVVLDTIQMGPLSAGTHTFDWDATAYPNTELTFKVVANNGADTVTATSYMHDKVISVGMQDGQLAVQLANLGTVSYSAIKAIQ
jgi:flagellar basal-body rod modification protein FlgD